MPPKHKPSAARDLVPIGPREIFARAGKVKEKGNRSERETTTRALVLRNGKYGARGTGEIVLASRMTGREKLDLLAEDLLEKSKTAILRPFRLEECLKIAESQCDVYIDDVANLREAELFYHVIEVELSARNSPNRENIRKNPSYVAKVVATRLHNSYMLASAWKIVSETLNYFAINGVTDQNIKAKLKSDVGFRERYLVLCDMVNTLVDLSQNRFSVLATTTPHYAKFFKLRPTEGADPGEAEYIFDWTDLRKATESFVDSIIIELCFPRGVYPETILYQLLHDAIKESPKDANRFPQALWDAVGDLSVSVELKEQLDGSLLGSDGDQWKQQPRQMPKEYDDWFDAQIYSRKASDMFANFKDVIFPLEKTKKQPHLDTMWRNINQNYRSVSGKGVDELWNLAENFNYAPQWTSYFVPSLAGRASDNDKAPGLALVRKKNNNNNKNTTRLRLTNGDGLSTDSEMPSLQSVSGSDTDDDDDDDDFSDVEDGEDDDDDDDESGYNTEEEDEIRELLREAMDAAHEADWLSGADIPKEIDPLEQDDHKGNPFLKLLGSLRGRVFSSSPKLKTDPKAGAAHGASTASSTGLPKPAAATGPPKAAATPVGSRAQETLPKSFKATVEDASDEEQIASPSKKKKKKKPKKKKKSASGDTLSATPLVQSLAESTLNATRNVAATPPTSPKIPALSNSRPTPPKSPPAKTPSFMSSTSTLPIGPTTAQSGHAYLQSQNIKTEKKPKSRPDHASLFSNPETEKKKNFFAKFSLHNSKEQEQKMKEAKQSWFSKLGKKTTNLMHQLLRTSGEKSGDMKWDDFVKLMKEMGFTYDPSTAGSSVRFDPPSKGDPPITFHKPHPDPTLKREILRNYAQRLKRRYGWDEADLAKLL